MLSSGLQWADDDDVRHYEEIVRNKKKYPVTIIQIVEGHGAYDKTDHNSLALPADCFINQFK